MRFVTSDIGTMVLNELHNASEIRLAVAYFNPDDKVFTALCSIPRLTLIISEEFTINNPYKLERLPTSAVVRSVPPDCESGKLHAKVLVVNRRDGSVWTLVGSANMTWQGLFSNQEACVVLESRNAADKAQVDEINRWFRTLLTTARSPALAEAKRIFDARSLYRLERRSASQVPEASYWALKATSGSNGEDHWSSFVAEGVIGIGWPHIAVNPSAVSQTRLEEAIKAAYPYPETDSEWGEADPHGAAIKIKKFVDLKDGDIVLICKGYPPNTSKPVHIRGFARVTGSFRDDPASNWAWRFKHDAVIQVVDQYLPKDVVAKALNKGSLRGTIHQINQIGFESIAQILGVHLEV